MKNLPKVADRQFYQHYGQAHSGQLQTRAAVLIRGGETTGQDGTKKKMVSTPTITKSTEWSFLMCAFSCSNILLREGSPSKC